MYSIILKTERHFNYSGHERLPVNRLGYRLAMGIDEPIRFAHGGGNISKEVYHFFKSEYPLIRKGINGMIRHAEKFKRDASATATATINNSQEIQPKDTK